VTFERIDRRKNALSKLDALQRKNDLQQEAFAALDEHYEAALNISQRRKRRKLLPLILKKRHCAKPMVKTDLVKVV
jgi:formyltetrahydrofolate hydrolase